MTATVIVVVQAAVAVLTVPALFSLTVLCEYERWWCFGWAMSDRSTSPGFGS